MEQNNTLESKIANSPNEEIKNQLQETISSDGLKLKRSNPTDNINNTMSNSSNFTNDSSNLSGMNSRYPYNSMSYGGGMMGGSMYNQSSYGMNSYGSQQYGGMYNGQMNGMPGQMVPPPQNFRTQYTGILTGLQSILNLSYASLGIVGYGQDFIKLTLKGILMLFRGGGNLIYKILMISQIKQMLSLIWKKKRTTEDLMASFEQIEKGKLSMTKKLFNRAMTILRVISAAAGIIYNQRLERNIKRVIQEQKRRQEQLKEREENKMNLMEENFFNQIEESQQEADQQKKEDDSDNEDPLNSNKENLIDDSQSGVEINEVEQNKEQGGDEEEIFEKNMLDQLDQKQNDEQINQIIDTNGGSTKEEVKDFNSQFLSVNQSMIKLRKTRSEEYYDQISNNNQENIKKMLQIQSKDAYIQYGWNGSNSVENSTEPQAQSTIIKDENDHQAFQEEIRQIEEPIKPQVQFMASRPWLRKAKSTSEAPSNPE